MANFHSDEWIMNKINDHYKEALKYFPEDRIVCLCCQGSQNYGLDYEKSDIDTKLVVLPTFKEIAFNCKPHSTTHIRENEEHIDFKDLRLMFQVFRKQNLNFLEILFTKYKIVNPTYEQFWQELEMNREVIARYNRYQAIKSMRGIAKEKYFAMEHEYPSKIEIIKKFGYDGKQLSHLLRIEDYIERYIKGEPYEFCLKPTNPQLLMDTKLNKYSLVDGRAMAENAITHIDIMCNEFLTTVEKNSNPKVDILLNSVQYEIMKKSLKLELM